MVFIFMYLLFLFPFYHETILSCFFLSFFFFRDLFSHSVREMCTVKKGGYDCEMRFPLVAGLKYRPISYHISFFVSIYAVQAHMRDTGAYHIIHDFSTLIQPLTFPRLLG